MILDWNRYYYGGCQMITKSTIPSTFIWSYTVRKKFSFPCLIHSFIHSYLNGFRDSYFILLVIICYSVTYSLSQIVLDGGHWESLKLAFWWVSIIFWEFSYFLAPQNVLGFSCTFSCPSLESLISSRPGSFFLENDILEI